MPLQLEIVTPEGKALEKTTDSVVLPGSMGEVGILPGHIPLTIMLDPGELRFSGESGSDSLIISRGFALVANDTVSVLTDAAIDEENIDEQHVEDARRRAEEALAEGHALDPDEVERLESVVRFSIAQLVARKKR
jgi:F-type H+-transporting ATPase subunit epsilon